MDQKKLLLSFIASLTALTAHCASFMVDTLSLTTLDDEARTVRLTRVKSQAAELDIPETVVYEGVTYTVTSLYLNFPTTDAAGNNAPNVTTVKVPKTVEEIAKLKGSRLKTVLFAEGSRLRTIGMDAFSGCGSLMEISLPESVETIGERAFESCSVLTGMAIPGNVTTIKTRTFYKCSVLTDIKLPSGLEVIEKEAFLSANKNCPKRRIVLPEGLLSIGKYAFDYAEIHPTGTVPPVLDPNAFDSGVTVVIDDMALLGIYSNADVWKNYVSSMEIEVDGLTYEINSDGAKLVKVPEGERIIKVPETISYETYQFAVTSIEDNVFPTSTEELYIKARVSTIGKQSFGYNNNLNHVELPASLERIEDGTFRDCDFLKRINIPDNVEYIGEEAFRSSGIETFTAPAKLTEISDRMLAYCRQLRIVTLHDKIKSIGASAFFRCTKLTELSLPATLESIALSAVDYTSMTELRIPHTIREITGNCSSDCLKNIFITGGSNDTYADIDGVLFRKIKDTGKKELMYYPSGRDAAEYTVPDGTVGILEYAFCRKYTYVYFAPTPLKRVNLPEGLESIGDSAFAHNYSLEHINLPKGLKRIGHYAFYYDRKVRIRVPETVTYIGSFAFCMMNTIYIDAIQPPSCGSSPLGDGAIICVKPEAVDAYKTAYGWCVCKVLSEGDVHEIDDLIYVPNGPSGAELAGCVRNPNDTLDIPQTVVIGGEQRNVTAIGESALYRVNLKAVNIPETVDSIESSCFFQCDGLTSVNIGNARIKWPNFDDCGDLQEITAGENNAYYTTLDGVLYSKAMDTLQYYPLASHETYYLPVSVRVIGNNVLHSSYAWETLTKFYSISNTIPVCATSSFRGLHQILTTGDGGSVSSRITLYVPENLVDAYSNADGWKKFLVEDNNSGKVYGIVGLSDEEVKEVILTGIDDIKTDRRVRNDGVYYTLSGQRVTNPGKGLYIRNGKKVIVR